MNNNLPLKITELIEKFSEHYDKYKQTDYNETQTRREFIDPLFKELGWDIDNVEGNAEHYKEVIHEDRVKIGGNTKSPDYSFRIGGQRKFFVEAKKPSIDLQNSKDSAFQLRRYGWTAGLTLCVLTDFEEFCVYQTNNIKPQKDDNPSKARVFYCRYDELANPCKQYPEFATNWDFIVGTFTKQAILKGRFDKFADKKKKSQETFDEEFLKSIQEWRVKIAENVVLRNKITIFGEDSIDLLKEQQLNSVVVKTIDRLIFLRICEDRGIERFEQLLEVSKKKDIYKELLVLFKKSNDIYNAGLFEEKNKEGIADVSRLINIDDKILKGIIQELYDTYSFEFVPLDILGQIYENFLGDTVTFERGKPKIDTKPEVKKSGGVYYTPEYIIDYIVENTIGDALKTRNIKTIEPFRICDPACGSGAFLIVAYEYIMKWYVEQYKNAGSKGVKFIYQNDKGDISLVLNERKRILKDHIFGVDIDKQAVEVAKLSLLLKCLEGVTKDNIENHNKLFHDKALPNIDNNIKCGNSLIGTDYGSGNLFNLEESIKVNAFDWESEFGQVFKDDGFDCVVGNPPYVFTRDVEWSEFVKDYFWKNYLISNTNNKSKANQSGKINLYALFLLQAIKKSNKNGIFGFIIPNGLLRTTTYDMVRKNLLETSHIKRIVDLKDGVFKGATVPTILFIYNKNTQNKNVEIVDANPKMNNNEITKQILHTINQDIFLKNTSYAFSIFSDSCQEIIFQKMRNKTISLGNICTDIIAGVACGKELIFKNSNGENYKKLLDGKDIKKYKINFNEKYLLFEREKIARTRPDYLWQASKKIIMQRISGGNIPLVATIDVERYHCFNSTNSILIKDEYLKDFSYEFICALLNSKLINFYYVKNFTNKSNLTVNISKTYLETLPIKIPTTQEQTHLANLAQQMLDMNNRMGDVKVSEIEKTHLRRQIEATDKLIDRAVYELYDLSDNEIKVVENLVV